MLPCGPRDSGLCVLSGSCRAVSRAAASHCSHGATSPCQGFEGRNVAVGAISCPAFRVVEQLFHIGVGHDIAIDEPGAPVNFLPGFCAFSLHHSRFGRVHTRQQGRYPKHSGRYSESPIAYSTNRTRRVIIVTKS